jgi:hypothetical protein
MPSLILPEFQADVDSIRDGSGAARLTCTSFLLSLVLFALTQWNLN